MYDASSGRSYRTGATLTPANGEKLVTAAAALSMSVSGLIDLLVHRMPVDEHGRPLWADELEDREGRLPLDTESDAA